MSGNFTIIENILPGKEKEFAELKEKIEKMAVQILDPATKSTRELEIALVAANEKLRSCRGFRCHLVSAPRLRDLETECFGRAVEPSFEELQKLIQRRKEEKLPLPANGDYSFESYKKQFGECFNCALCPMVEKKGAKYIQTIPVLFGYTPGNFPCDFPADFVETNPYVAELDYSQFKRWFALHTAKEMRDLALRIESMLPSLFQLTMERERTREKYEQMRARIEADRRAFRILEKEIPSFDEWRKSWPYYFTRVKDFGEWLKRWSAHDVNKIYLSGISPVGPMSYEKSV